MGMKGGGKWGGREGADGDEGRGQMGGREGTDGDEGRGQMGRKGGGKWRGKEGADGEEGRGVDGEEGRGPDKENGIGWQMEERELKEYDFKGEAISQRTLVWKVVTLACCVCSYEKFSGAPTNKEPVIMNIEQKVTHA